jgi:hypothetical protein
MRDAALLFKEEHRNYDSQNFWGPEIKIDFLKIAHVHCKADGVFGHYAAIDVVRSTACSLALKRD